MLSFAVENAQFSINIQKRPKVRRLNERFSNLKKKRSIDINCYFFFLHLWFFLRRKKIKKCAQYCLRCRSFFFCLLFFFSPSVVLFVGQRQKQMTKLFSFFVCFWLRYLRVTQCVSLNVLEKRLKKWPKKNFHSQLFASFSSTSEAFLTEEIAYFYFKWPSGSQNSKLDLWRSWDSVLREIS